VLVHAVLESFATVDENHGDFVGELAAELVVGVNVDFLPVEAAAAMEFGKGLLDDLAEVAAFAGVHHDLAGLRHGASLAEAGKYEKAPTTEARGARERINRRERRSSQKEAKAITTKDTKGHKGKPDASRYNPIMRREKPLEGEVALITGGAKRLGRASALALAKAGADVAITFRESAIDAQHTVIDLSSFGVRAIAVRCDITDEKSVRNAIKETRLELGGIDILVNNAANYDAAEFDKLTLKRWDAIFATNTRGPFLVSREAVKLLRARRGKIINMGSLGGLRPWATNAHYCSSKAAVHMLTKVMAKALAPEIAVNCVAPGMIDLGEKAAKAVFLKRMAKQTPMRRNGTAEDIAAAVLFFATAPHFITGQIMAVDGGLGL
jgi:NAD(P)-dependent dehydrogenase (short-subunit alcohol dehydrogenase family)